MTRLEFRVYGDPKPQGSKTLLSGRMIESAGQPLKAWRADVRQAALDEIAATGTRLEGAVELVVTFALRRPRSHFSAARGHEHELKPSAPIFHSQRPDLDKLQRALGDALTSSGVFADDAQLALVKMTKTWCDPGEQPGAYVTLCELAESRIDGLIW